jgi:hypothetical protein
MRARRTAVSPPTTIQWRIDAELHGHRPSETMKYLSDCADHKDQIAERRRRGDDYIIATSEPFWRRFRWTC